MERCKTCRWWTEAKRYGRPGYRECSNYEKIGESIQGDDVLSYSYDEGGRFYPGPEFGCVHHEAARDAGGKGK